jgi:hypothetical protein
MTAWILRLVVGISVALGGTFVLYAFRVRQLYLVIPKLFPYGGLTGNSVLIELQVFNKSRYMEEEVQISLPPNAKYEVVAADYQDVKVVENKIVLPRLAPLSDVSILVLADGQFNNNNVVGSLTSKATKGTQCKKREDVPPNVGNMVAGFLVGGIIFVSALYGMDVHFDAERADMQKEAQEDMAKIKRDEDEKKKQQDAKVQSYDYLKNDGWQDYTDYLDTQSLRAYAPHGFPVSFTFAKCVKSLCRFNFVAVNNTTSPITVAAYNTYFGEIAAARFDVDRDVGKVLVNPLSSKAISVSKLFLPKMNNDKYEVKFFVTFGPATGSEVLEFEFHPTHNAAAALAMGIKPAEVQSSGQK